MRGDLLSLNEDSLAALANRGIVRRAARDVAEASGPTLDVAGDDTVVATHVDGIVTTLPPATALERATCSCGASGVCRHKVAAVLVYQQTFSSATTASPAGWSPASFTDGELEKVFGARIMISARQAFRGGYRARVRRPTEADPVPSVELGSCTVRFLVPEDLGYARTDAARGSRDEAVPLAVWAFRAADAANTTAAEVELDIGGQVSEQEEQGALQSGVEPALLLVQDLVIDGAAHIGASINGAFTKARRDLESLNLRWPVDVLDGLQDQLDAYRSRSARYGSDRFAGLLAELVARHRCVIARGASLRSQVLGTEESSETSLRHLRLTGIGCRVSGDADSRSVRIYFAHTEAGCVLVLDKRWELDEGDSAGGHQIGERRLAGTTVAALAGGNLVTASAVRSARRAVRIASNRVAKTTVAPSAGRWTDLPQGVLVRDLQALAAKLAGMPPRLVRPRVEADQVHVVELGEVVGVGYEPGMQRLTARVQASQRGEATVVLSHRGMTSGALDALAAALTGSGDSRPRFISGITYRFRGDVVIEPLAVVSDGAVVVPDLAPGQATQDLAVGMPAVDDPLLSALDDALQLSAEVAHRGLRHLPPTFGNRIQATASRLRAVGLARAADALAGFGASLHTGQPESAVSRWFDSHIRLMLTAECL